MRTITKMTPCGPSALSLRVMTEIWLPVPECEADYLVSNLGGVFSLPRRDSAGRYRAGRMLRVTPDTNGYPQVNLCYQGKRVHSTVHVLVLTAFSGPCPADMEARHLNDVKTDNRWPENLVWGTRPENQGTDRLANGTSNRGERHGLHKLTETEVLEIFSRLQRGERVATVAAAYGRSRQCITHIKMGRRWGWLTEGRNVRGR